jgi:hypothetical protein
MRYINHGFSIGPGPIVTDPGVGHISPLFVVGPSPIDSINSGVGNGTTTGGFSIGPVTTVGHEAVPVIPSLLSFW